MVENTTSSSSWTLQKRLMGKLIEHCSKKIKIINILGNGLFTNDVTDIKWWPFSFPMSGFYETTDPFDIVTKLSTCVVNEWRGLPFKENELSKNEF